MKRIVLALLLCFAATQATAQNMIYRPITSYSFSVTNTAGVARVGQALQPQSRIARVICSVSCWVAFPVTPIVAAASVPVLVSQYREEYFRVTPGTYVYVIRYSSDGMIHVTEME